MVKMVSKGPFMEYLRAFLVQAAINTLAEIQIPTPTSKTENMAMLIHSIELHPGKLVDATPTDADIVYAHLSSKSKTAIGYISDEEILAHYRAHTSLNAVFNDVTYVGEQKTTFDPPILYPKANLYAAVNSVGMAAVVNLSVRIGYTLEKVSREDFISALVE